MCFRTGITTTHYRIGGGAGSAAPLSRRVEQNTRLWPPLGRRQRGFFEQQGLDTQLILLRGVPMTLQALAASSLQIGRSHEANR
jgi:hypothetical protein